MRTAIDSLSDAGAVTPDKRGEHPKNVISEEMRDVIRSHFSRVESRYLYLKDNLTLAEMYQMYKSDQEATGKPVAKYWLYVHIFNTEFNLGFFKPKKDQCSLCAEYENKTAEEREEMKSVIEQHLKNKALSHDMKEADKKVAQEDSTAVAAVYDLQKVISLPCGEVSLFYYKRKLSLYNFIYCVRHGEE